MKRGLKRGLIGAVISALMVALDQFTKYLAVTYLKDQPDIVLWEGVFELEYLENRGAAFGIMQGQKIFFVIFTSVAMAAIAWFFLKKIPDAKRYRFLDVICVMLFAGGIGNFIDRIRLNYVIDFFYFSLIDFPIFNVADIYVTVAAFAMILLGMFYYKDEDYDLIFPAKKKKDKNEYAD
ncbi:MAG: signal peptidase II [Roseburia sp.]|nr:signal peptidase II [Roseburia sp.]